MDMCSLTWTMKGTCDCGMWKNIKDICAIRAQPLRLSQVGTYWTGNKINVTPTIVSIFGFGWQ